MLSNQDPAKFIPQGCSMEGTDSCGKQAAAYCKDKYTLKQRGDSIVYNTTKDASGKTVKKVVCFDNTDYHGHEIRHVSNVRPAQIPAARGAHGAHRSSGLSAASATTSRALRAVLIGARRVAGGERRRVPAALPQAEGLQLFHIHQRRPQRAEERQGEGLLPQNEEGQPQSAQRLLPDVRTARMPEGCGRARARAKISLSALPWGLSA